MDFFSAVGLCKVLFGGKFPPDCSRDLFACYKQCVSVKIYACNMKQM